MVSGFKTSPKLRSKIESGDARPIVILEKVDLGRLSFLIAIYDFKFENENFCFFPLIQWVITGSDMHK
jgi:hypothetical protein